MKPARILLPVFFFVLSLRLAAQPSAQWDYMLPIGLTGKMAMVQTADGGYLVGMTSDSDAGGIKSENSKGSADYWIIKLSPDRTVEWERTIGGAGYDLLAALIQTTDDGYIIAGQSVSDAGGDKTENSKGGWDMWVVKLASDGSTEWDKSIGASGADGASSVVQTKDGGIIVAGTSTSGLSGDKTKASNGESDYWIVKLDEDGNILWDSSVGGFYEDTVTALDTTADGGVIVGGISKSGAGGDKTDHFRGFQDYWIVKLSAEGAKEWDKTFGGGEEGSSDLQSVHQTADLGYIVGGHSSASDEFEKSEPSKGAFDYWVIKLAADGSIQWQKTLSGVPIIDEAGGRRASERLADVRQTASGDYIVAGTSSSGIGADRTAAYIGPSDVWILKLAPDGSIIWDESYGEAKVSTLILMKPTSDGGYVLASPEMPGNEPGFWIIKLGPETTLPVTLAHFKVQKENTTANLTWQTTSETLSDRFEVEHSTTGKSWTNISTIKTKGESSDLVSYQYSHATPSHGENLYRLKMIDLDRTFSYSKIERVKIDLGFSVTVYPNPAAENIHILAADWSKVKNVEILNSLGKSIYQSGNKPVQSINAKSLSAGLYFVKVGLADRSETVQKLVVGR
jgi:hypothetical protein